MNTTRRTLITGAAALPLLPAAALAAPVTLPLLPVSAYAGANDALTHHLDANATDYHWQRYHAAKIAFEATDRDYTAMEASLPDHLKLTAMPNWTEYSPGEWRKRVDAWNRDRAELGAQVVGEACDKAAGLVGDAEAAVLDIPGTTLIDLERKLTIVSGWNGDNHIPAELVDGILADVRSLMGVAS